MNIYPAIDLRQGRVVRLKQGDFAQETVFGEDPVAQAVQFAQEGATWLHMVDLDGAARGKGMNRFIVRLVKEQTELKIQLGGGIRSLQAMEYWLGQGMDRLIIGTQALLEPTLVGKAVQEFGSERIVIGIDARDGKVATHGWNQTSDQTVFEFAQEMRSRGVTQVLYTDIGRDGMLVGPDLSGLKKLISLQGLKVIASGGVATYQDLQMLKGLGVEGVIIGQALYTGILTLPRIFEEVR